MLRTKPASSCVHNIYINLGVIQMTTVIFKIWPRLLDYQCFVCVQRSYLALFCVVASKWISGHDCGESIFDCVPGCSWWWWSTGGISCWDASFSSGLYCSSEHVKPIRASTTNVQHATPRFWHAWLRTTRRQIICCKWWLFWSNKVSSVIDQF